MSSSDELVRGIRRIVGEQEEKPTGLGDAEARKAIGISRGVGFVRSDGSVSGGGGEGAGDDDAPPDVPADEPGADETVPADGGTINPGSDTGGAGKTDGDVADVYDDLTGGAIVGTVTGTQSGTPTSITLGTICGLEYTPPTGWEDACTPFPEYSYSSGSVWVHLNPSPGFTYHYTATELLDSIFAGAGAGVRSDYTLEAKGSNDVYGNPLYYVVYQGTPGLFADAVKGLCTQYGGSSSACTVPPSQAVLDSCEPMAPDSVCAISYDCDAGGYKGADNDPDCDAGQLVPETCQTMKSDTQPTRYVRVCRLADGGSKMTEVDSGGAPVPGTITKILDPDGKAVGFVDVALDNFYQ